MKKGLVHLYHGDGKGKTTASMGLALRAAGRGNRVLIVQFLKERPTGEVLALEGLPGVRVLRGKSSGKFFYQMDEGEREETHRRQQALFSEAVQAAQEGRCDLLVLDEALDACNMGLIDSTALCLFLRNKPAAVEIVLTGRNPAEELIDIADYVSFIQKQKHPYEAGVKAREGIEY